MSTDNTIDIVRLALDSCAMRQSALTANMANINTDGYQTVSVNFEEQLEQISEVNEQSLSTIKPFYQTEDITLPADVLMTQAIKNQDLRKTHLN
jgi:flagellar basal-body rod protein FlgB